MKSAKDILIDMLIDHRALLRDKRLMCELSHDEITREFWRLIRGVGYHSVDECFQYCWQDTVAEAARDLCEQAAHLAAQEAGLGEWSDTGLFVESTGLRHSCRRELPKGGSR